MWLPPESVKVVANVQCSRLDYVESGPYYLLDGLPVFAQIPKRKINQELKKNVTRLGFEPAISCVAIGYSNYLAIDKKEEKNNQ